MEEWNNLCNFARYQYEEHLCEIILNLDKWLILRKVYGCTTDEDILFADKIAKLTNTLTRVLAHLGQWLRRRL